MDCGSSPRQTPGPSRAGAQPSGLAPANRTPVGWALVGLMSLAAAWSAVQQWRGDPLLRAYVQSLPHAPPQVATEPLGHVDAEIRQAAGSGNLVVRFVGFDVHSPYFAPVFLRAYMRGNYALYPRRVFVVPEGTLLKSHTLLAEIGFDPDETWRREHGVTNVLTLQPEPVP